MISDDIKWNETCPISHLKWPTLTVIKVYCLCSLSTSVFTAAETEVENWDSDVD